MAAKVTFKQVNQMMPKSFNSFLLYLESDVNSLSSFFLHDPSSAYLFYFIYYWSPPDPQKLWSYHPPYFSNTLSFWLLEERPQDTLIKSSILYTSASSSSSFRFIFLTLVIWSYICKVSVCLYLLSHLISYWQNVSSLMTIILLIMFYSLFFYLPWSILCAKSSA